MFNTELYDKTFIPIFKDDIGTDADSETWIMVFGAKQPPLYLMTKWIVDSF